MNKGLRSLFLVGVLAVGVIISGSLLSWKNDYAYLIKSHRPAVAEAADAPSANFAWHPNRPGIKRAQIALGRAATLRFEFFIKDRPNVTNVKFGLPKKYADMGIKIDPPHVVVSEGKAASKAVFSVPPGMPLGRFDVPIVAVDAKTGEEIGRGDIPIMLLPAGVGGC